jgi:hypothetical protein
MSRLVSIMVVKLAGETRVEQDDECQVKDNMESDYSPFAYLVESFLCKDV